MTRPFASYFMGNIEISREELEIAFISVCLFLTVFPLAVLIISSVLSSITKLSIFNSISNWCLDLFTHGIIEQIFISTIKYINTPRCHTYSTEIPKDQTFHRMNKKLFTRINTKRIKRSAALLFPFQAYILSIIILDQLFMFDRSIQTCETYQQVFKNNPLYAKECLMRPNSVANISASEFFNPINAFRPITQTLSMTASSVCQNLSMPRNETLLTDYHIECTKHLFRGNNIINTLTNVLQWHQITIFIIKTILYFTFSWQNALGHSQWWLNASMIYRLPILVLLTVLWAAILVIYVLIIIAFNKVIASAQVFVTFQTGALLLIPILIIPLPFYNTLTVFHWAIRTIRRKKCEQEVSLTFDTYRNVLIYTEDMTDNIK